MSLRMTILCRITSYSASTATASSHSSRRTSPTTPPRASPTLLARRAITTATSRSNPLNAFTPHYDAVRGWHYHVTPGQFPYIIGGFFAKVEPATLDGPAAHVRNGGPRGGSPTNGGAGGPPLF